MPLPVAVVLIAALPAPDVPGHEPLPPGVTARYGGLHYRVPGPIDASALSPDGKLLAVATTAAVRVYELPAWRSARAFPLPAGAAGPAALRFSPDGRLLAYARVGGPAAVWDVPRDRPVRVFPPAELPGRLLGFTPDGRLAAATADKLLVIDPATGEEVRSVPASGVVALSPDGASLVRFDRSPAGGPEGEAVVGDARTGADRGRLGGPFSADGLALSVAFAPDGKTLALARWDGRSVELRDAATGAVTATLNPPRQAEPVGRYPPGTFAGRYGRSAVEFAADGRTLFVTLWDGDVGRWALPGRAPRLTLAAGRDARLVAVHAPPGGRTILTPTADGTVRVWDAETAAEQAVPGRYRGRVWAVPSPDGSLVAVSDAGGRLDLRDAATGRLVRAAQAPEPGGEDGRRPVFSPDGRSLAYVSQATALPGRPRAEIIRVERAADGARPRELAGDPGGVPIGFTPAGLLLVAAPDSHRGPTAWDPGTGWGSQTRWHVGRVRAVSPDGRLLAAVADQGVEVWDVATGRPLRAGEARLPLARRRPEDRSDWPPNWLLAWSGDGRTLAVVQVRGGEVDVFDPRAGRRTGGFAVPRPIDPAGRSAPAAESAHLSPDGRWLATGGPDGGTVWEVMTGRPVLALPAGREGLEARFTADGRGLVVARPGYAERVEVVRPAAGKPPAALWAEARDAGDAGAGVRAAAALVGTADGRVLLAERLPPAARDPAEAARVAGWIADLGGDDYPTREAATKELTARARAFEGVLREALRKANSPEVRRRLTAALAGLGGPTPDEVRAARLVQAAELAGTPEARALVEGWAGGLPGATLTEEAKASLARMGKK